MTCSDHYALSCGTLGVNSIDPRALSAAAAPAVVPLSLRLCRVLE